MLNRQIDSLPELWAVTPVAISIPTKIAKITVGVDQNIAKEPSPSKDKDWDFR